MSWEDNLVSGSPAYELAASEAKRLQAIAGPGTGKSYALRKRITKLLEQGVDPKRILAVTFTRTAAADLKREIGSLEVHGASKVHAGTLHSLSFKILNKKEIFTALGRTPRPILEFEKRAMIRDLSDEYGDVKKREELVKAYEAGWARLQRDDPGFPLDDKDKQFESDLVEWLTFHESMLLGEIVPYTMKYLEDNPACRERQMYDHILVDEYQDLNRSEQRLVNLLAKDSHLTVVGDDDQSIYSFKYAHPDGIRDFAIENEGCVKVEFNECQRCPSALVNLASTLINRNSNRTLGDILPKQGNDIGNIHIIQWKSIDDEILGTSELIAHYLNQGEINPGDVLILTPRRLIGHKIRNLISDRGFKVRSYFREKELESKEARFKFSLLNLAANNEDRVALRYLLGAIDQNQDSHGFRSSSYRRLQSKAIELGCSVKDVLDKMVKDEITVPYAGGAVQYYKKICAKLQEIKQLAETSPEAILEYFAPEGDESLVDFRDVLSTVIESIGTREDDVDPEIWISKLYAEVRDAISMPEVPEKVDHVRIMSLHASKGLSAKFVVLVGAIDGLTPPYKQGTVIAKDVLEEARRLFYVAITRCKNVPGVYPGTLVISSCTQMSGAYAARLGLETNPSSLRMSRFVGELGISRPRPIAGSEFLKMLQNT